MPPVTKPAQGKDQGLTSLERQVLERLAARDSAAPTLIAQIAHLTVTMRWYSGVGAVTYFAISGDVPRVDRGRRSFPDRHDKPNKPDFILEHPALTSGAGALGFLNDGIIHNLECFTYEGDWPEDEGLFRIVDAAVPH